MFTGIIEELGSISALSEHGGGVRLQVAAKIVTVGTVNGDSIAVNGVCLTALETNADGFSADVSRETLGRTTIGNLKSGSPVNLERAVTPATRLGGHIVQGHVDGRGQFLSAKQDGDFWTLAIGFPVEMAKYFVYKGSVCVEGISLTIAKLTDTYFEIALIPKTWEMTNLSTLKSGDAVNLEADVLAKYIERMMQFQTKSPDISKEILKSAGFI